MCVIYYLIVRKSLLIDVNQSLKPIFFCSFARNLE